MTTTNVQTNKDGSVSMSGTVTSMGTWSAPERVEVNGYKDRLEIIYKQTSMTTLTIFPSPPPEVRVFKIVFSCVSGEWNQSDPIYGKVIPAQKESYEFE